jgi:hypothetical protein
MSVSLNRSSKKGNVVEVSFDNLEDYEQPTTESDK